MIYDYNILEEKIKSLPDDMQIAMFSPEVSEQVQDVAEKYSLDIEQTGVLMDITSYVMLALIPSKNFVAELAKEAQIDTEKATNIAKDINDEVFAGIKESLRKIQEIAEKNAADQVATQPPERPSPNILNRPAPVSRANILETIENTDTHPNLPINILTAVPAPQTAQPTTPSMPGQINTTTPPAPSPLMNRLMSGPSTTTNKKVEKKVAPLQPVPDFRPGSDPYREPIE